MRLGEDLGPSIPRPQPNLREAGSNPPAVIVRERERPRESKLCRDVRACVDTRPTEGGSGNKGVDHSSGLSAILVFTSLSTINPQPHWRFVFRRPGSTPARLHKPRIYDDSLAST